MTEVDMFKVGDRVRCVNPAGRLVCGDVYAVTAVDGRSIGVSVDAAPLAAGWDQSRFERLADPDAVNSPSHYVRGGFELIDVIESWELTYGLGSCVAYIFRAKFKGSELEDLRKARWYLNREIERMEAGK